MVDKPARFNCVALAIGAILAVWGCGNDRRTGLAFIGSSVAVPGTVVRLTHGAHRPLIEFVTKSGERVSFPGSFVTVEFGDTVPVRYDPARPQASATVDTFTNMWLESIVSIAFTMAFLYAGLKEKSLLPKPGGGRWVVRQASRRCQPSTRMRQTQKSLRLGGFICTIKDSW